MQQTAVYIIAGTPCSDKTNNKFRKIDSFT